MNSTLKKHFYYWILPSIFVAISMLIYLFDILGLAFIIAPEINREFGLIENTQLIIILGIFIIAFKALRKEKINFKKYIFIAFSLLSIFMFLEEIDYGAHIVDYYHGRSWTEALAKNGGENNIINIHNQGNLLHYIKLSAYVSFALFLVIVPAIIRKTKFSNIYLNWLIPSTYFIYTLISMTALNQVARFIDKKMEHATVTSLHKNVSEFEEVFIYYIMLLYIFELVYKNVFIKEKEA